MGRDKGGPYWQFKADVTVARALRKAFPEMKFTRTMAVWGHRVVGAEKRLLTMATANDAELKRLPKKLPGLYEYISGRPYQRADVKFMAECANPLNANAPSLGKTFESIASVYESGNEKGAHLVIAPLTSLDVVWEEALSTWQNYPVLVALGSPQARREVVLEAQRLSSIGKPFWLVVNPAMLQLVKDKDESLIAGKTVLYHRYPELQEIYWNTVIVDEFHKCGLANKNTLTRKGITMLPAQKRIAMSGTPIGGKTRKLWGILNYLEPALFSSEWKWIDQWLETSKNRAGYMEVGDIRPGLEEEFYRTHARFMVRRTKEEARAELTSKDELRTDVWCHMAPAQAAQYQEFAKEAEIRIDEERLSATSILAEYTRLRQFASAVQELRDGIPYPTQDSCKLTQLIRILGEHGIAAKGSADDEGNEQVVVFSQFSKMVDMVHEAIADMGIACEKLTGATKQGDRAALIRGFERGEIRVLCMTTTAGGTAITLNNSDAIVFLDETWNPDDQEQGEDRNRNNTAILYYLRTRDTIEEYILALNLDKRGVNKAILDARRKGFHA